MFFFFYYDCVCSFRLLLVSYLIQLQFIKFGVSVAPRYVPSPSSPMPVTTRSQSKHPQNDNRVHSFTSTSGSHLSSMTSSTISTCNFTTASSVPVLPCNNNTISSFCLDCSTTTLDNYASNDLHYLRSISSIPSPVSKFQNLEISNTSNIDSGFQYNSFHNLEVSNTTIMDPDLPESKASTMMPPKQDDPPDLNAFLAAIQGHIELATTKMAGDFHQVIASNDLFKKRYLILLMISNAKLT